ncbi:MAG: glycoside hydrolase family 65 protein [Acidimicrobiia bacterium]|nr:glycoside hydrolase family 65 protein [Acidimicrobiia bacterium]
MKKRTPVQLPEEIYPDDPWVLLEDQFAPDFLYLTETIFALTNGRLGVRGSLDEGDPHHIIGTYINGFHETWPITHAESAYGLAEVGQTMVTIPDGTLIEITVDGEVFHLPSVEIVRCRRWLDIRRGLLERDIAWRTESGVTVDLRFLRFVSLDVADLIGTRLEVSVDRPAEVRVVSRLRNRLDEFVGTGHPDDPRLAKQFSQRVLEPRAATLDDLRFVQGWVTAHSRMGLLSGMDHQLSGSRPSVSLDRSAMNFGFEFEWRLTPYAGVTIDKFVAAGTNGDSPGLEDRQQIGRILNQAKQRGLPGLAADHERILAEFWEHNDIVVTGADVETQRAIRWTLLQLYANSACLRDTSIPAKGLTGHAYDGHYFWDTEIYILPFLIYTNPDAARRVLTHRYSMLEHARARARTLSHDGILFPWRTINGEEASAYFLAGTAQYHINADIVYAIRKYVEVTGDREFLWDMGAEIVLETAKFWHDLGFYRSDHFHIHGVTGPDEYTALVDDNAYTNAMARMNLRYAFEVASSMSAEAPEHWEALRRKVGIADGETIDWRLAADAMYIPHDRDLGITPQDDDFLQKEAWDFENTPESKYPLLLHFHPLTIYRFQVLKQADVVLADFLLGEEFNDELKRANFDFYEPLTTGDSSLSACIQAIMSAELGYDKAAMRHFHHALYMDLGDIAGNTTDGVHMASAGGVWMALVYGFAGMRDVRGTISFEPRMPTEWSEMQFEVRVRDARLSVRLSHGSISLASTEAIEVVVDGESHTVTPDGSTVVRYGD